MCGFAQDFPGDREVFEHPRAEEAAITEIFNRLDRFRDGSNLARMD